MVDLLETRHHDLLARGILCKYIELEQALWISVRNSTDPLKQREAAALLREILSVYDSSPTLGKSLSLRVRLQEETAVLGTSRDKRYDPAGIVQRMTTEEPFTALKNEYNYLAARRGVRCRARESSGDEIPHVEDASEILAVDLVVCGL